MQWFKYTIKNKREGTSGVYIFNLIPKDKPLPQFKPGQYVFIKNPGYKHPDEEHAFSFASSPSEEFEFCIREYGEWTKTFCKLKQEDTIFLSEPQGSFTYDKSITQAIFLCGGVGISPFMSILESLNGEKNNSQITLFYGNRTPDSVVYKEKLQELTKTLPSFSVINIYSEERSADPNDYFGFITKDMITQNTNLFKNPDWFITGPEIFVQKMEEILTSLHIEEKKIHVEKV